MKRQLFCFLCLFTLLLPLKLWAQEPVVIQDAEPYAILDGTTLTFYYDTKKEERNGMSVGPFTNFEERGWNEARESITSVVFDESFADCTTLTSTAYWFNGCSHLTTITDIQYLKTDNVTDMTVMFFYCSGLTSLDLGGFKTDNVTDMTAMFFYCSGLTSLDLSGFNTSNVKDMSYMFQGCSGLTSLDVSSFKTDNVTDMYQMFTGCSSLTSLNLSGFNTDNVTDMYGMFSSCSGLTSLDLSSFNTDNVTNMSFMFYGCSSLTTFDLSSFNTSNVSDMSGMFFNNAMTILDLSNFNTASVTNMMGMFRMCPNLTTIYVSDSWNTANVTNGDEMFMDCYNLKGGQGTEYMQGNWGMDYAHIDGGENNPGYMSDKNAPVVIDEIMAYGVLTDQMTKMTLYYDKDIASHTEGMALPWGELLNGYEYNHARETLVTIDIDPSFANFNTLESSGYLFAGCMQLTNINGLEYFITENMTDMREMFASCESLTVLDLSSFKTSKVTSMFGMFMGCHNLTTIIVGDGWDITALTDEGHEMFADCTHLVGGMGTTYSEPNFNADYAHVDGGLSNPGYLTGTAEPVITEFEVNGIVYRVRHQQSEHQVMVAHVIHAEEELYVPSEVPYANIHWHVTALAEKAFVDLHETKAIEIPGSIDSVSVDLFNHCPHLAAILWEPNVPLTTAAMGEFNNPNLLLFITNTANAPAGVTNVIDMSTGVAEKIVLSDAANGGNDFYCPEPFKAKEISYTHSYDQATKIGICEGWESIVVPFDVQTYTHETKGEIYPISSLLDEQIEYDGDKPFWLYAFTSNDEFVEADKIMANTPYIISMPNDPEYWDSYILTGRVTFSAKDIEIYPTHEVMFVESQYRLFMPNYANADYENPDAFLLNVGDAYDGHLPGSVFSSERPARRARPFEAYFVPTGYNPVKRYMDIFDNDTEAIREIPMASKTKEGVYDLMGRKVINGSWLMDNDQLPKGVYIIDGKKVMVK